MSDKIALITDTHFGLRGDSQPFMDYIKEFFDNVFFPYLIEHNIKTVIHGGDIFDRRKFVNYSTLLQTKEMFFDRLKELNINFIAIVGNHDTYYKSTNEVNSPELLLAQYDNVKIIVDDVREVTFNNTSITFLPWLTPENSERLLADLLKFSKTDYVISHLELAGFETLKGIVHQEGMSPKYFENFNQILSGHYHYKSKKDNIFYIGNPYENTWADYSTEKGFYVIDTHTKELTFIENPIKMFHIIYYDDTTSTEITIPENIKNRYVKVIVKNKNNQMNFDKFIDKLHSIELLSLTVVEDISVITESYDIDDNSEVEMTQSTLRKYVDSLDIKSNEKDDLQVLLEGVYKEAMYMED